MVGDLLVMAVSGRPLYDIGFEYGVVRALPMFLLIPALLKRGLGFYPALVLGCLLTMALYGLMIWVGPKLGLKL
ncbi:MAG: hypothetical protein EBS42_17220 [Caulobacteraceae bacterium]|nr:hypothetical protein [Caulobacteraceae bacterium]